MAEGYGIVVDMDLEKFFDRVNHDVMMARLARRVADKRLLRIVRRYLEVFPPRVRRIERQETYGLARPWYATRVQTAKTVGHWCYEPV